MAIPTMDHRGPEFTRLTEAVIDGMQRVFKTVAGVVIFSASGTGLRKAALVNTLSAGDRVLMLEPGQFATVALRPHSTIWPITTDGRLQQNQPAADGKHRQ